MVALYLPINVQFFVLMRYTWNFDGSYEHMSALRMPPLVAPSAMDLPASEILEALQENRD